MFLSPENESATAPTALCAIAEPVPNAIPCIIVEPKPDIIPPPDEGAGAGAGAGARGAGAGGGGALAVDADLVGALAGALGAGRYKNKRNILILLRNSKKHFDKELYKNNYYDFQLTDEEERLPILIKLIY